MAYAGDVSSAEAYAALRADPAALLVDCRTRAEWQFVGVPAPDERVTFVAPGAPVYFICRSGARSRDAAIAATAAGYRAAFNVADGFEGPVGPGGRRDVAGWKVAGLPWSQS